MSSSDREREFTEFARAHGDWLFRVSLALTTDWQLAEDLTQATLAKVFSSWSKVTRADSPRAYVRGIALKTWLSRQRRKSSWELPVAEPPERAQAGGDVVDSLLVVETLKLLSPRDRAVLVLRFLEDRSLEQTARDLDMTTTAVSTATTRALARARAVIDPAPNDAGTKGGRP